MIDATPAAPAAPADERASLADRALALGRRAADPAVLHAASLVIALVVLVVLNRRNWFVGDDWDFLGTRRADDWFNDLWRPHVDHWSTVPLLAYRLLFAVVGLRTMWPYLLLALLAHLGIAHLAWRMARRDGADPWIATGMTAIFLLLGTGAENLTWTFQTTTNGAILLGYAAVTLATAERPVAGRTLLVNAAAVASVMSSAVGLFLAGSLALAGWTRGGWRRAASWAALSLGLFLVWYAAAGRAATADDPVSRSQLLHLPRIVVTALAQGIERNVGITGTGVVLLAAVLVWLLARFAGGTTGGPSFAVAAAVVPVFASIGIGRADGGDLGAGLASRYTYVAVALTLPVLVLAVSDLAAWLASGAVARWRVYLGLLALAALLVGQNLSMLVQFADWQMGVVNGFRRQIHAGIALSRRGEPLLDPVPEAVASRELDGVEARRLVAMGALPLDEPSADDLVDARLRMQVSIDRVPRARGAAIVSLGERVLPVAGTSCEQVRDGGELRLRPTGPQASVALELPGADTLALGLRPVSGPGAATRTVDLAGLGDRVVISTVAAAHEVRVTLPGGAVRVCGTGR